MATIRAFVSRLAITASAERVSDNPNFPGSENMDNWKVRLRSGAGRQLTTYFSMGIGLKGKEPAAADVLDCMASDAAGIDNARSFDDWCSEYGYNSDSRKAEKTFRTCERQAAQLRRFLNGEYENLLYKTERL